MFASPDLSQKSLRTEQIITEASQAMSRYFPLVTDFQLEPVGIKEELLDNISNPTFQLVLNGNTLRLVTGKSEIKSIESIELFGLNGKRVFLKNDIKLGRQREFDIKKSFSSGVVPNMLVWRITFGGIKETGLVVN